MPKLGMEPIRRRQLIVATLAAIHEDGLGETTLARVSARAGLSTGLVNHYFNGKADLLEASLRWLAAGLRGEVVTRLAAARAPHDRVLAVIDGNLSPRQFTPEAVAAWLAFWAEVRAHPRFARIQRIIARRLESNLLHGLRRLLPAAAARHAASGLGALIDGLWLRCALTEGGVPPAAARALCRDYLACQIAKAGGAPARSKDAFHTETHTMEDENER